MSYIFTAHTDAQLLSLYRRAMAYSPRNTGFVAAIKAEGKARKVRLSVARK